MPYRFARIASLNRDLKLLWAAVFCVMSGMGIYASTFFNFATEVLKIQPNQLGKLEAIRETPGFLCVLFAALTMRVLEPLLGSFSMLLMAVGLGAYAWIGNVHQLMLCSFIWSVGFHAWVPVQSSLVIGLSGDGIKGKRLGQTASVGSIGMLAGMGGVMILGHTIPYPVWFLIGGGAMGVGGIITLRLRRDIGHAEKPRLVVKRRYWLYYALTLLEGCRKQVFMTFAIYALTKEYGIHLQVIALLMVINNAVNMLSSPIVGRMIDRIGERKILVTSYAALVPVFLGYALIPHAGALCVIYCLDNLCYLSTTCLTTYIQKIAEPGDLMPTLSMGVTFNHTFAVLVPLIGGYLWNAYGYPVTFFGGTAVVFVSLLLASRVRTKVVRASV